MLLFKVALLQVHQGMHPTLQVNRELQWILSTEELQPRQEPDLEMLLRITIQIIILVVAILRLVINGDYDI